MNQFIIPQQDKERKTKRITINKYINLKRLQYVIELHKKGHSLIYACMEAKFPNYEAFTYLYKKEFGCSPSKDFPN